jgi:hypothetical protein
MNNKTMENNFTKLERLNIKKFGSAPKDIQDNINKNLSVFKTIGETVELFTEKFIKTFIKMNG